MSVNDEKLTDLIDRLDRPFNETLTVLENCKKRRNQLIKEGSLNSEYEALKTLIQTIEDKLGEMKVRIDEVD